MQDIPLLLDSKQYFFIYHMISPTGLFHPPPAPHFKTPGVSDVLPEASKFQHHINYAPNVALH
jgi:hypothetical protein